MTKVGKQPELFFRLFDLIDLPKTTLYTYLNLNNYTIFSVFGLENLSKS